MTFRSNILPRCSILANVYIRMSGAVITPTTRSTGTNTFDEKDGTKTEQTVNPSTSTGAATVSKVKIP